jgi:DnaJ-class molecular chaperone
MKQTSDECRECGGFGYHRMTCGTCDGSGQGTYDGSRCHACKGNGEHDQPCEHCAGTGFSDRHRRDMEREDAYWDRVEEDTRGTDW